VFSLYYSNTPGLSKITLGGYDEEKNYYEDDLVWINAAHDSYYWESLVNAVKIGGKEFAIEDGRIIFDSGSSVLYLPEDPGKEIIKKLLHWTGLWFKFFGQYYIKCKENKHKDLAFLIEGYWIHVDPAGYILSGNNLFCTLGIQLIDSSNLYILGSPLMRTYYMVFDPDNESVGFSPKIGSDKDVKIKKGDQPKKKLK